MDFDMSKENIQPLRGGRNVSQLGVALQAQTDMEYQRELMLQKEEFEKLIRTYSGDDPLDNWYNYISWIEQSYPKQGQEGNLIPLLEHCLQVFEHDKRYKDDRRLCKLFIKYIDLQHNPVELYHMMYAQGLCRGSADMYRAWGYYYEAASDFQNAHRVFECGKRELAQPFDELQHAHENLIIAAGQHIIYGPNEHDLSEKRQALTSLYSYKHGQVASVRTPSSSNLGILGSAVATRSNSSVSIYEDKGDELHGAEAAPFSIIAAARRQEVPKENTLKPGPWTTVPVKKRQAVQRSTPSFTVHEDSGDSGDNINVNVFVTETSENYSDWIVNLTVPEPHDDRMMRMYPKKKVYSEITTEYSLEEIRAARYFLKKNKFVVATLETNKAVQSILDDASVMEFSDNKLFEKATSQENSHHRIYKQPVANDEQKEKKFSILGRPSEDTGAANKTQYPFEGVRVENPIPSLETSASASERQKVSWNPNLDFWNDSSPDVSEKIYTSNTVAPKFAIYEQSNLTFQEPIEPKGSAMKTPFKDLNAEELAETGSRGGMDVAAAAPVDSAKRLPIYDDDSSSSCDKNMKKVNLGDLSCNTQMFNFNLNLMQVSTPQNKQDLVISPDGDSAKKNARKQLFSETYKSECEKGGKALSVIFEETKSSGHSSSASSSSATTKSSSLNSHTKPNNMATISEEHNNYLAQNLMVNAALRSSLGDLMGFSHSSPVAVVENSDIIGIPDSLVASTSMAMKITPLNFVPSDPFKQSLIERLLERVNFPGIHTRGYCYLHFVPKLMVRKETVNIGSDKYVIEKQLGKGTFGIVFRGVDLRTGNTVAVKFQKPGNKWEFYICRELQSRLINHPLRERFMDVSIGYFSDQSSILISQFMPCGSLLDVANMVKQKSGRSMKESLCIYFCLEMLKVVQTMHEVKIIHADIKPDNFLVQLFPNDTIGLQLIDFGCSIDMTLFPSGASFMRKVTTEDFVCCEMIEGRPWNYHTDLFCIAATAHVLLFEKYIQLQKRDGHWSISNRLPRYARLDLWNMFFSTLLNQQSGVADSTALQAMLEDSLNHKFDDYHNELRYLTNILKNR